MAKVNRGKLDDTLAAMFSNVKYSKSYLFWAHMIGQCSIKIRDDLPAPAGVAFMNDHYNLYINPKMYDEYDLHGRLAILKHEMIHILDDHIGRIDDRVFLPWNYATDCALNQLIDPEHLPDCAITPKTLGAMLDITVPENKSAEFYYDLIKDTVEDQQKNQSGEDGDGEGQMMDSHEVWEESKGDKDLQQDITKKMIEKAQEETIKGAGTIPGECSEWLEMHTRKSEVNWKKVLRGIVGNKRVGKRTTIMKSDRRFPKRADLRGKVKDRMFNLLVIADVSGSMSDTAVLNTLGEVRHICDITKTDVDLIQIDTQAYTPEKLSKKTKLIQRKGHGGTILSPALEKAKEHNIDYNAIVVLTDGWIFSDDMEKFSNVNKKIIWLIEPNGKMMDEMNTGRMRAFKMKQ